MLPILYIKKVVCGFDHKTILFSYFFLTLSHLSYKKEFNADILRRITRFLKNCEFYLFIFSHTPSI